MARTAAPPDYWDWVFWLKHLGRPGLEIGNDDDPYLIRYYLLPRNPYFNAYLHKFMRSDIDEADHSHPWCAMSLILRTGYWEHRRGKVRWRRPGSVSLLTPRTFHRVELDTEIIDGQHVEQPAWTLFFTGPSRGRTWFFRCPRGLVEWKQFNGCGEA